jgi:hypothetical protein
MQLLAQLDRLSSENETFIMVLGEWDVSGDCMHRSTIKLQCFGPKSAVSWWMGDGMGSSARSAPIRNQT